MATCMVTNGSQRGRGRSFRRRGNRSRVGIGQRTSGHIASGAGPVRRAATLDGGVIGEDGGRRLRRPLPEPQGRGQTPWVVAGRSYGPR